MTEQLGIDLAELIMPWIAILISLMTGLWMKDFIANFVTGFKFKMNPGINQTVFGVYSERGYTWRYIQNTRMSYVKLEKVVSSEMHMDTPIEKANKLQALLDEAQSNQIEQNKKAIKEIKNGKK